MELLRPDVQNSAKLKQIRKLRQEGHTYGQIEKLTGVPRKCIVKLCRKYWGEFGLKAPPSKMETEERQWLGSEIIRLLLLEEFISTKNVAKILSTTEKVVSDTARKYIAPETIALRKSLAGKYGYDIRAKVYKDLPPHLTADAVMYIAELEHTQFLDLETRYRQGLL